MATDSSPNSSMLPPHPPPTSSRPSAGARRPSSRMAGAFEPGSDIRDDVAHAGTIHEHDEGRSASSHAQSDSSLLPPQFDMPNSLLDESQAQFTYTKNDDDHPAVMNTVLEEEDMKKRLADFESSFLPDQSAISDQLDSTAASLPADVFDPELLDTQTTGGVSTSKEHKDSQLGHPRTPTFEDPPQYQPEPHAQEIHNTSSLSAEQMSSSPTAARTVSRVQSLASTAGYETAAEVDGPESPVFRKRARSVGQDPDQTPRKDRTISNLDTSGTVKVNVEDFDELPLNVTRRRPQYLSKRSSNARLSYDSMASSTTETSEATLGADFALQSGGAAPDSMRLRRKPNMTLSRSTSLGSLASGVSGMSDDEAQISRRVGAGVPPDLTTLEEESPSILRQSRATATGSPGAVVTPRASTMRLSMPTDSVIANHVRDLKVPDTIARAYNKERSRSPEKKFDLSMATMTPGPKRGLTLKEHRSTVEKLGKENFDLKMKIHFLDQALQKRSEDGIKEMITENVQLKSDRLRLEKDNHNLRKSVRDLQRKLDAANGKSEGDDQGYATDDERSPTVEEEVMYLRERIEITEIDMEKLRQENIHKETEKRRLAEMVRNLGDSRPGASEVGSREERDMWKDMLEAETIAREQAEDDAKKLRDELAKIRQDSSRPTSKLKVVGGKVVSRSSSVDGSQVKANTAELERLRHECSELQKTIGAQASALTSRNKEKEMLYQEIENLKLGKMGGLRSVAGDSIFERSASRARSNSRASNATRYTRLSDGERENMESRIDQLRDEVSQLKLDKQNLQNQFDEALAELDAVDAQAQADADAFNDELALLTQERDNALREAEDQDGAFQQLKNEAQQEIDGLGDELDAKIEECTKMEEELKAQGTNVKALQAEMRSAAEGLVRLEEDAQQNLARYQAVKAELDDSNRELENLEKNLHEAQSKNERLTVQRESSQNEIAFLREEQDADKIKIGDLESLLKKTHLNLDAERDRARDFERRLTEERAQRDAVASHEKQEIQRTINELNREASSSKNELRQVRKVLSQREIEVTNFKDRLGQLEDSLRKILGLPEATSSHLIGAISKMAKELDQANVDLDSTRQRLDEHKKLLADRDNLLEDAAFESRRLDELLEKERTYRRQDKHSFDQALRSHEQSSRMVGTTNARIAELEQARLAHRKQLSNLEAQYKDQLAERNQVLLTIWRKLSVMCGPDWAHNHSLINGNLPSQEVIGNMIFWPGFSRNLLLAVKQVEGVLSGFKDKIRNIERDLYRNYNALEKEFEARNKKLERIEQHWEAIKLREREIEAGLASSHGIRASKIQDKLKQENKLLKAELRLYQDHHGAHVGHARSHERTDRDRPGTESRFSDFSGGRISQHDGYTSTDALNGVPNRGSSIRTPKKSNVTISRNNSSGAVDRSESITSRSSGRTNSGFGFTMGNPATTLAASHSQGLSTSREDVRRSLVVPSGPAQYPANGNFGVPPGSSHSHASELSAGTVTQSLSTSGKGDEKKWIHRLRELERRLKTEREHRLVDRDGARRRLEERDETNEKLKRALERERLGRGWKLDHAVDSERGGYLVADEPTISEVIGQMNTQTREEYIPGMDDSEPSTPYNLDEQQQQGRQLGDDDEGLRTSEEDRLMGTAAGAQYPTVGSSHAQRHANKTRAGAGLGRPESTRTVSRGSMVSTSPSRPGFAPSIKERFTARANSYNLTHQNSHTGSQQSSDSGGRSNSNGERWGKNGCEKDANVNASDGRGEGDGVRRIMRTASAMAGVGGVS